MKSRSVKQKCPSGCDGAGTIHGEDNGGDGSPQYPIYEVLRDCPVCAAKKSSPAGKRDEPKL